jgi:hypothetical protein
MEAAAWRSFHGSGEALGFQGFFDYMNAAAGANLARLSMTTYKIGALRADTLIEHETAD